MSVSSTLPVHRVDATSWRVCSLPATFLQAQPEKQATLWTITNQGRGKGVMGKCTPLLRVCPEGTWIPPLTCYTSRGLISRGPEGTILPWRWGQADPAGHTTFLHWATMNWSPVRLLKRRGSSALAKWSQHVTKPNATLRTTHQSPVTQQ